MTCSTLGYIATHISKCLLEAEQLVYVEAMVVKKIFNAQTSSLHQNGSIPVAPVSLAPVPVAPRGVRIEYQ